MGNGKNKPQTVNNINQLNLEIDYDKLAEAIVKAQETVTQKTEKKEKRRTRFRNILLRNVNGVVYHGIAIFMVLLIIGTWVTYKNGTGPSLVLSIVFTLLFAFLCFISFMCGQETFDDTYETTVSLFDTNVSLIALVVAIIALYKGVG